MEEVGLYGEISPSTGKKSGTGLTCPEWRPNSWDRPKSNKAVASSGVVRSTMTTILPFRLILIEAPGSAGRVAWEAMPHRW
jgi:hypothetical protein